MDGYVPSVPTEPRPLRAEPQPRTEPPSWQQRLQSLGMVGLEQAEAEALVVEFGRRHGVEVGPTLGWMRRMAGTLGRDARTGQPIPISWTQVGRSALQGLMADARLCWGADERRWPGGQRHPRPPARR